MIDYFNHYILPTSPARAKVCVHLFAQGTSPDIPSGLAAAAMDNSTTVLEKGMKALGITKDEKSEEDVEVASPAMQANGTTPLVIIDVREFKSKLQVGAGPQPVKHISEFEELDSKL